MMKGTQDRATRSFARAGEGGRPKLDACKDAFKEGDVEANRGGELAFSQLSTFSLLSVFSG